MRPLIVATALAIASALQAATPASMWRMPDGTRIKGRVSEVFGTYVVIAASSATAVIPSDKMSDDELGRVADFLATRPAAPAWKQSRSVMARPVLSSVERLQDGQFAEFDPGDRPEPDIYLVYFSAGWCGPCHRFTPKLIRAYERYQQLAPGRVEVVCVSWDKDEAGQLAYAREMRMPWPVVKFRFSQSVLELKRWERTGIPCLVALTRGGDLLAHSYRGQEYLGPSQVLDICDQLVAAMLNRSFSARRASHRLAVAQHLRSAGAGDRPPGRYLVALDAAKFSGIRAPATTVEVSVDEQGHVKGVEFQPDFSMDLQRMVEESASEWLFLPAVKSGRPCAQRIRVPLKFGGG